MTRLGYGFGINRIAPVPGGGGGSSPVLELGDTILHFGTGESSVAAIPDRRSQSRSFQLRTGGFLTPAPGAEQAISNFLNEALARVDLAIAQQADVPILWSCGHKDGLWSTDPDVNSTHIDRWEQLVEEWVTGHPDAKIIPIEYCLQSTQVGETAPIKAKVQARMDAKIAALADDRIRVSDPNSNGWDPATMTSDGVIHCNDIGKNFRANLMLSVTADDFPASTVELTGGDYRATSTSLDAIAAALLDGSHPHGAATNYAAQFTATGDVTITNNTTATVGVSYSNGEITVTVSGTVSSANTVVITDTANTFLTASSNGQYPLVGQRVAIDDGAGGAFTGLHNWGMTWGSYANLGTGQNLSTNVSGNEDEPIDAVMVLTPLPLFSGASNHFAKMAVTLRLAAGSVSGQVRLKSRFARLYDDVRAAASYYGENGIVGSNYKLRPIGSISGASGGTLTVWRGSWSPAGLTNAMFTQVRVYKGGGGGDANIGMGTLIATGTGVSIPIDAADVAQNDVLYLEQDAASGIGSSKTTRSTFSVTVGA